MDLGFSGNQALARQELLSLNIVFCASSSYCMCIDTLGEFTVDVSILDPITLGTFKTYPPLGFTYRFINFLPQ